MWCGRVVVEECLVAAGVDNVSTTWLYDGGGVAVVVVVVVVEVVVADRTRRSDL